MRHMLIKKWDKFNEAWDENSGEYVNYDGYINKDAFIEIHDYLGNSEYGVEQFNEMLSELNVRKSKLPSEIRDLISEIKGDLSGVKGKIVDLFSLLTKEDMSHLK